MKADYLNPAVVAYCTAHTTQPDQILRDLAAETLSLTGDAAGMQISPDQGVLLTMLVQLSGARLAVEVGTFTGYSSICIARGMPQGRLIACDVSDEWTAIARRYWERALVTDRIELRLGPAEGTLRAMPDAEEIDFAFIDADKGGYPVYYEEIMKRLRPGGLIAIDNTLQHGRVTDPDATGQAKLMREFNDQVTADVRATSVLVPVADGLTLVRKN